MFKFLKDDETGPTNGLAESNVANQPVLPATEIVISERHYRFVAPDGQQKCVPCSSVPLRGKRDGVPDIKYVQIAKLANHVQMDSKINEILHSTSDLVPSVYEGGFKIWECTFDLIKYLETNTGAYQFGNDTMVLDIGCGSGLLGLYAMSRGCVAHFQDYNPEVLHYLTIPNVLLNHGGHDETIAACRFFSGDWASLQNDLMTSDRISEFKYDYILTSETTYSVGSLPKLYNLMKHCLKPTGTVLLASKTCYFGVGGGTQAFLNHVQADGLLNAETVCTIREGVQREIILLKFKT